MTYIRQTQKHTRLFPALLGLTLGIFGPMSLAAEFRPNTSANTTNVVSPATTSSNSPSIEVAELQERIERLERMADNPVLLQLSRRLAEQQKEIQGLYDQMDRLQFELKNLKEQASKRYLDTDARLTQIEAGRDLTGQSESPPLVASVPLSHAQLPAETVEIGLVDKTNTAPETAAPSVPATKVDGVALKTRPATDEENLAYQAAFDLMKKKQYAESIQAFEVFRQKYPDSVLASNAAYWAGEGYLITGEKDKAMSAFEVVQTLYPDSSKQSAAMLRHADTLRDMNQKALAKSLYQKLIDQFPLSKVAEKAKTRMEGLDK